MENNDKEQLKKGQKVSKTTKISIKKDTGGKGLWPLTGGQVNEKLDVIADVTRAKKVVIIQMRWIPGVIRRGSDYWSYGNTELGELTCGEEGLVTKTSGRLRVYSETMRGAGHGEWKKDNNGSLNLEVSLEKCRKTEKEKIECSLNVVTKIN
ncbi:hypothetical protein DNK47_01250 [Mycoplasma wenyonii]|uniref:Uncharacterized protein n=1 Tax=Mycoplasma wenyonii TaxID=65123 RepID=A0A328PK54_9MOLU|nr:hypothetical protein [Mycoplasma wenyonii]RAO95232.1 hypothetical protein DNK47_01250 [Mycoplasma wenyonii]